jgi:pullulanase/glycogen debranching enzyme
MTLIYRLTRAVPCAAAAGSYAVEVDGAGRTREVREMVQGLHGAGLRVVLDVVYNHTFNSGVH